MKKVLSFRSTSTLLLPIGMPSPPLLNTVLLWRRVFVDPVPQLILWR